MVARLAGNETLRACESWEKRRSRLNPEKAEEEGEVWGGRKNGRVSGKVGGDSLVVICNIRHCMQMRFLPSETRGRIDLSCAGLGDAGGFGIARTMLIVQ